MKRRYLRLSTRAELRHTRETCRALFTSYTASQFGGLFRLQNFPSLTLTHQCHAACCFNPSIILASTCSLWGDTGSSLISICMIFAGSDRAIAWIPDTLNSACINHKASCPTELLLNQLMDSSPGNWIQIYLLFWERFILTI